MFFFDQWTDEKETEIVSIAYRPARFPMFTNGEEVAVKLESIKARHPQLLYESKLYKILQVKTKKTIEKLSTDQLVLVCYMNR